MRGRHTIAGLGIALLSAIGLSASAADIRDLVFECPCSARWTADGDGGGALTLQYALRSFRPNESGGVVLVPYQLGRSHWYPPQHPGNVDIGSKYPLVDGIGPFGVSARLESTIPVDRPAAGAVIGIALWEIVARLPEDRSWSDVYAEDNGVAFHEVLTMWPVRGDGDPDRIDFVDIQTDTDGDGIGDVNERTAGTAPDNAASTPGSTTIDVLAVYNNGMRECHRGLPQTHIHHIMAVANTIFEDNGTNVRLRTVGMTEIGDGVGATTDDRADLMDRHGADLYVQWHTPPSRGPTPRGCGIRFGGCENRLLESIGWRVRGYWSGDSGTFVGFGALVTVHEIGHIMGLGHSARQGEAWGAFRWSRGHYVASSGIPSGVGTIMSYGTKMPVFSNPAADCIIGPCGVPIDQPDGANAVASLDLLRFQIAANRDSKTDTDGDGFVDPADAFPEDDSEWSDADGDGVGDLADHDDDNDGVADADDVFPLDPNEWADADDDGVGDNADEDIQNLSPFRDASLRTAVEQALGKSPGEAISAAEMATLENLEARGRRIRDLAGLETARNLTRLDIASNGVADLTPLSGLTKLEELDIADTKVVDLSPLSGLTRLERLDLGITDVRDLSPLRNLTALQTLELRWCDFLTDVSPLASLELRSLDLTGSTNVDVSQLAHLGSLSDLRLNNLHLSDLSPLAELSGLSFLDLSANDISDLSPLGGLNGLTEFRLHRNPLSDISVVAGMSRLWRLDISMTKVEDLSPLRNLELARLNISWTPLSLNDVLVLPSAGTLTVLQAAGLQIRRIPPLGDLDAVVSLDLSYNLISDIAPLVRHWDGCRACYWVDLTGNPLDDESLRTSRPSSRPA